MTIGHRDPIFPALMVLCSRGCESLGTSVSQIKTVIGPIRKIPIPTLGLSKVEVLVYSSDRCGWIVEGPPSNVPMVLTLEHCAVQDHYTLTKLNSGKFGSWKENGSPWPIWNDGQKHSMRTKTLVFSLVFWQA